MILHIVYSVILLAAGFGLGRVKNKSKLAAVSAEIAKVENSVVPEVKALVTSIKSHL